MELAAGSRLGPYEVVEAIGAGGMGEVYRARDTRLDRCVALKILPAHFSCSPELKSRFEREARTLSSVSHPHICHLYDVGSQSGTDFLVMELLEGETLDARLRKGALASNEVLKIGIEIADALCSAHRLGLVHRDLKPSNVMLTKTGAKLMDFGLAKPATNPLSHTAGGARATSAETLTTVQSPGSPITSKAAIVGTIQYMSPEQLEGRDADARSDLFAFGAVLYEMATGQRAFEGKSFTYHFEGSNCRHHSIHVSRTAGRQRCRRPQRPLCIRSCPLRDGDRSARFRREVVHVGCFCHFAQRGTACDRSPANFTAGTELHHFNLSRQ